MTSEFTFDEATHSYFLDGRQVPSVTQVIRRFVPQWQAGEWYLTRGKAVHCAVALALAGKLDWETVDPRIKGRVEAVLIFIEENLLKPIAIEHSMASDLHLFAGTPDLIAIDPEERCVLIDYKSTVEPIVEVQLGLYAKLWNRYGTMKIHRACALETRDDSAYKAHWYHHRQLENAGNHGLAMLSIYNWLEKNGLNKKEL